jgi:NAD(P) transhydrogenase subunit beta
VIGTVQIGADGLTAIYLVSAACFVLALKALSSPRNARYGNLVGVAGMVVAIALTFLAPSLAHRPGHDWVIGAGMALGALVAIPAARKVPMTGIPQMVAIFNGVGGAAAAVISLDEYLFYLPKVPSQKGVEILFAMVVGCLSFAGSALAFAKLQELMTGRPVMYPGQQVVNALTAVAVVALGVVIVVSPHLWAILLLAAVALALGAGVVLPVGGADTPVLISLLNSFTGLAVAADGFVLDNVVLVVAGTLVGASGALLTKMMSDAMGRSLPNIVLGGFGAAPEGGAEAGAGAEGRSVRSGDATDIGTLLAYSRKVIIVPGYGLAVAQAQHVAVELARALAGRGVEVSYAIHPVAGRMPGHMNVLLAEANAPYEDLTEMDQANDEFASTDVALVVGANDVVNPAARDNPGSPIYGMPILNVDMAANVVFLKRSMRPGFSGVDNALLYDPKTILLFGDAKDSLTRLLAAVKAS